MSGPTASSCGHTGAVGFGTGCGPSHKTKARRPFLNGFIDLDKFPFLCEEGRFNTVPPKQKEKENSTVADQLHREISSLEEDLSAALTDLEIGAPALQLHFNFNKKTPRIFFLQKKNSIFFQIDGYRNYPFLTFWGMGRG